MTSKAQLKAQSKYDRSHTRSILLKLNLQNDADILSKLDDTENRQGYVKELIRQDIRKDMEVLPVDSIRYLILPVIKKNNIRAVWLSGSYARKEAAPDSEIALMIDGENIRTVSDYLSVVKQFEEALHKKTDIVTAEAVCQDGNGPGKRFQQDIWKDKVTLYEDTEWKRS